MHAKLETRSGRLGKRVSFPAPTPRAWRTLCFVVFALKNQKRLYKAYELLNCDLEGPLCFRLQPAVLKKWSSALIDWPERWWICLLRWLFQRRVAC